MNLTDIVLILILIFVAFAGASTGFFKSLSGVASYVASAFVAKIAALPVAKACYARFVQLKVIDALNTVFPTGSVEGELDAVIDKTAQAIPGYAGAALKYFSPDITQSGDSVLTVAHLESAYVAPVITKALTWIATVVIFILCALLIRVIFNALDKMLFKRKNPGLLSWANRLLGFVLGAVKGTLIVFAACLILNFIAPLLGENSFVSNISSSAVCTFVSQII